MKRFTLLFALFSIAGAAAGQSVVYNTIGGSYTRYGSTGYQLSGDNFILPALASGQSYAITGLSFVVFASAPGTYSVPVTISFYNTVTGSGLATDPAFSGLAGGVRTTISNFTASAAGSGLILSPTGFNIPLAAQGNSAYGIQFQFGSTTSTNGGTGNLSLGYTTAATSVPGSGSSNGMYIDMSNGDGVLTSNEFYTLGTSTVYRNAAFSLTAQVVQATPEPSAVAALGLGVAALLRRRKRA